MIAVETKNQIGLKDYKGIIEDSLYEEIESLAKELKGLKVCHINATAYGGGVAEILHQLLPLATSVGINYDWKVIEGTSDFFEVTKKIHNTLQGDPMDISHEEWATYSSCNVSFTKKFNPDDYDVVFVHDPQPAKMISCMEKGNAAWIWRCHIDTSTPNHEVADYFKDCLSLYDASVFTMEDYVFKGLKNIYIIPPAIDAMSDKNKIISKKEAAGIMEKFNIDITRYTVTQVSRFDPWKDPVGVVEAYRIAKETIPELQLVYAGSMADDDPEGFDILEEMRKVVGNDKDVHILSNLDGVHNLEINAMQTYSDVILQKSTKEGFGLTVSEALWKGTPVIGGNVGGIPTQIIDEKCGYLVESVPDCAKKIVSLLRNEDLRNKMGAYGREHVRRNFLMPRLLRDELKMFKEVLKKVRV